MFLGYSFSVILLPEKIQKYSLALSPFVGATFIIIIALALGAAKIAMNENIISGNLPLQLKGFQIIIILLPSTI